jgi:hypothetical protein
MKKYLGLFAIVCMMWSLEVSAQTEKTAPLSQATATTTQGATSNSMGAAANTAASTEGSKAEERSCLQFAYRMGVHMYNWGYSPQEIADGVLYYYHGCNGL